MSRALHLIGGWSGVLGPTAYVTTWAVLGASRADYDPIGQAISELGELGAATSPAMAAAFVVFGLSAVPFAAALSRVLPAGGRSVGVTAVVCGLATVGAAMFPCSPGCPGAGATATDTGHAIMAVTGYIALMATPLLTWRQLRRAGDRWRPFAWWSLAAGGVGTLLMLLWALGVFGGAGGAAQRAFNTLADIWWLTAGVVLLRTTGGEGLDDG